MLLRLNGSNGYGSFPPQNFQVALLNGPDNCWERPKAILTGPYPRSELKLETLLTFNLYLGKYQWLLP
jgi:hypothetical protein